MSEQNGCPIHVPIRIIYNEESNVIMMITGSASQMRGPEFSRDKRLFPGYRRMGLSRNSACLNNNNGQMQS